MSVRNDNDIRKISQELNSMMCAGRRGTWTCLRRKQWIIFDGVSSSEMGIPSRMSVQNRIPDIRNNTDKLAGRHGIMDFGETISERKIEITCLIPPGLNAHQLLDKKDSIVGWLNPDKGLCRLELGRSRTDIIMQGFWTGCPS